MERRAHETRQLDPHTEDYLRRKSNKPKSDFWILIWGGAIGLIVLGVFGLHAKWQGYTIALGIGTLLVMVTRYAYYHYHPK